MPLTEFQRVVVGVLRPFRSADNYLAGGAALNRQWPRLSDDMDIFLDRRGRLPGGVDAELEALRGAGYSVEITTRDEWTVEAIVRRFGFETRVQWMDDPETCRRFFPAIEDDELGFRLHQADVAVNKVLCASRRAEPRDAVDLVNIVRLYAPLGPLAWAAAGKDPTVNPLRILAGIRATAFGLSDEQVRTVRMEDGSALSRDLVREALGPALDDAYAYCEELAPVDRDGHLFVDTDDIPIAATEEGLSSGAARELSLRDFTAIPTLDTGED